jgi:uncharacterized protein YdaU (DUF1376 family)
MNYYPFNVGDYAAHTAHLEPMEDLAYRRLLDVYYLREGPLPADIQATAKLVRMRSMASDVESVLREFFTLTDEGWKHSRCEAEIVRMQDKQAKARASAHVSVSVRRANAERTRKKQQADAERTLPVAQADVELPTPTPTPIQEKYIPARKRAAAARLVSVSDMEDEGVDPGNAADWLTARKAKGLPLTPTAWKQTKDEAAKAGMTIAAAIKTAAGNGWAGFKASWVHDQPQHGRRAQEAVTVASDADKATAAYLAEQEEHARKAAPPPDLSALKVKLAIARSA